MAVFSFEAVSWAIPGGLISQPPGMALWALTLLLVGVNEELFVRGVVLSLLERAYSRAAAAVLSGVIFGAMHFSALVMTGRDVVDVTQNVVLSGIIGVAYAAFQVRYRWIWPLVVIHTTADFVTILAARPLPDAVVVAAHAAMLAIAVVLLRRPAPVVADRA